MQKRESGDETHKLKHGSKRRCCSPEICLHLIGIRSQDYIKDVKVFGLPVSPARKSQDKQKPQIVRVGFVYREH